MLELFPLIGPNDCVIIQESFTPQSFPEEFILSLALLQLALAQICFLNDLSSVLLSHSFEKLLVSFSFGLLVRVLFLLLSLFDSRVLFLLLLLSLAGRVIIFRLVFHLLLLSLAGRVIIFRLVFHLPLLSLVGKLIFRLLLPRLIDLLPFLLILLSLVD